MRNISVRLQPGDDLKTSLHKLVKNKNLQAAFVLCGIGSLSQYALRFAGRKEATIKTGMFEICSLSGTLSQDGLHLHATVSNENGSVTGGHVLDGCLIRTTAEILVVEMEGITFKRKFDSATGFNELLIE